jgi:heme exporter protein C
MYLGLIALWQTIEEFGMAAKAAAILTLVGAVNIPIVKFSVDWWSTLHQGPSVFRLDGPAMPASMLWPLLVMAFASTLLFLLLHLMAIRNEVLRRRLHRLAMNAAMGGGALGAVPALRTAG